jgi:3-(3-hydroxy-phenyl)propionate hydroxylase
MDSPTHSSVYRCDYRRSADQAAHSVVRRPLVVIGAGPVGLAASIDLALRGLPVVLIDDADRIGAGSRGVCWAKRTLEICDRLGVGERMVAQGVSWTHGKVLHGDKLVFSFDLLPESGAKMPAFVNLPQFRLEKALVDRAAEIEVLDLRWKNRLIGLEQRNDHVRLTIDTPDGHYVLDADWLIAADGARSNTRDLLGLKFSGVTFEDKFLIADIRTGPDCPNERRFWFEPAFHSGQSAMMDPQPENVWRIDLQLWPDADMTEEQKPDRVGARLRRLLGKREFSLEWISIYRFNCRRLDGFVHGRVIFIGDAAHQVSPFGARGANSGIQDAENLAWKLAAVLKGEAGLSLIDSFERERMQAADENITNSTRSTDFIAPHSVAERQLRNAVLALARKAEFARRMINCGRLSVATVYDTNLSTPDESRFAGKARLGAPAPDAPVRTRAGHDGHLLENIGGEFTLLHFTNGDLSQVPAGLRIATIGEDFIDTLGAVARHYDATPGATYLLRPDQHLCARWRSFDRNKVAAARARALGG